MQKILSVIIPMYKVEDYVRKCLNSFILADNSLMNELEVLCINDGTPDHSADIAKEYEAKYPQTFRVIDKENGNYGSCINRGLKEAQGKYIRICDGDDSYETEGLATLLRLLAKLEVDLVITEYCVVNAGGKITCQDGLHTSCPKLPSDKVFDMKEYMSKTDFAFPPQMHRSTYRTSMLREIGYHQTEGISYTDQQWAIIPLIHARTAYYLPVLVYRYLLGREGQTMSTDNQVKNVPQLYQVLLDLADYYEHGNYDPFYKPFLVRCISWQLYGFYPETLIYHRGDKGALKDFDRKMAQYSDIYNMISKSRAYLRGHIAYIDYWRRHNYKDLPWLYRKLCAILEARGRRIAEKKSSVKSSQS